MSGKKTGFEFFEHPADAKFQAYGENLEGAFCNAAYALVSLMWNRENIQPKIEHPVAVEGKDLEQLLVGFLEEVLYLLDSHSFFLSSVVDLNIKNTGDRFILRGQFWGDRFEQGWETFGEVKAITYHEIMIQQDEHVMVQVVVDV
jgi:SHS2 domain-containing protein